MSETVINGHTRDCSWFEFAHCDCGYDDIWDPFLPADAEDDDDD